MEESTIESVTPDNFQTEVIEKSENVPVFVLFKNQNIIETTITVITLSLIHI